MIDVRNTSKIIYPEIFNTNYIYTYKTFNNELKEIIERSGYKLEFTRKYRRCLLFLENLKENCVKQNSFEKLTSYENFYSIRLKGEKNIRIIFTFATIKNKNYAILLYPFQEKDNKNNSKTSYSTAIEIAKKRLKELIID